MKIYLAQNLYLDYQIRQEKRTFVNFFARSLKARPERWVIRKIMGLTGFDRLCNCAYKHAGSWDESLER